jgi:hypothetical protein
MELLAWAGVMLVFIILVVAVVFWSSGTRKTRSKSDVAATPLLGVVMPNSKPGSYGKEEN